MDKLTKQGEQQAMLALEEAIKYANAGESPDDAIVKAAQEAKLGAPMVQRLVEAYNVSKSLHHFKKESGANRAATFPIASPENITALLFPPDPTTPQKEAAAALHPDQINFEEFLQTKEASEATAVVLPPMVAHPPEAYERDPAYFAKKAIDERGRLVSLHSRTTQTARQAYYEMLGCVDKAAAYFKQSKPTESFDLVEKRAFSEFGPASQFLMDLVVATGGLDDRRINVKRAAVEELGKQQMMFDPNVEPYSHISDAVLLSRTVARIGKEAAAVANTIDEHAITNVHFIPERDVLASITRQVEKKAKKDMPGFTEQDRPKKVKEIYSALKRDHPEYPAGKKARIASTAGKK